MEKIIFLDIDGPLIPFRAYWLSGNDVSNGVVSTFDPSAVALVNRLREAADAKFVISSTWGIMGLERIQDLLVENNMDPNHLHEDWITPRRLTSLRQDEIFWWLEEHPETTHWVAFDDEKVNFHNVNPTELEQRINNTGALVRTTFHEGILFKHFVEASRLLEVEEKWWDHYDAHVEGPYYKEQIA